MAFIKTQKIVCDDSGRIISGSASIVETIYGDFGTYHAKHKTRERLGRVIYLSEDRKSGIFLPRPEASLNTTPFLTHSL